MFIHLSVPESYLINAIEQKLRNQNRQQPQRHDVGDRSPYGRKYTTIFAGNQPRLLPRNPEGSYRRQLPLQPTQLHPYPPRQVNGRSWETEIAPNHSTPDQHRFQSAGPAQPHHPGYRRTQSDTNNHLVSRRLPHSPHQHHHRHHQHDDEFDEEETVIKHPYDIPAEFLRDSNSESSEDDSMPPPSPDPPRYAPTNRPVHVVSVGGVPRQDSRDSRRFLPPEPVPARLVHGPVPLVVLPTSRPHLLHSSRIQGPIDLVDSDSPSGSDYGPGGGWH